MGSVLEILDERGRDVFLRRIGAKNGRPETLEEIASCYGVTRERIRQLEDKAIDDLSGHIPNLNKKMVFIRTWNSAEMAKSAAKKLGISQGAASAMARSIRDTGIPLKAFNKGGRRKVLTDAERAAIDPAFKKRFVKRDLFIKMWNDGVHRSEIASKLGITKQSVNTKAYQLRGDGFNLVIRRARSKQKVNREEFIKAWQTSESLFDVCKKTGMNRSAVSQRRQTMTKLGIPLKTFRMTPRINPEMLSDLRALAASYNRGNK